MAFDFKKLVGSVAPMIGTALGGPLCGAAATVLVNKLGLQDKVPDPNDQAALAAAVTPLMSNPDTLLKVQEADNDFKETMAKLNIQSETDLEKLAVEDRGSARQREIAVKDYTPEVGFYLLLMVFAFFLHWLFKYPVPPDNRAIIYSAFGSLSTLVIMAATYFYGTTRGSEQKTTMLANSVPTAAVKQLNERK